MSNSTTSVRALGRLKARELSLEEANVVSGGIRAPGCSIATSTITGEISIEPDGSINGSDGGSDG